MSHPQCKQFCTLWLSPEADQQLYHRRGIRGLVCVVPSNCGIRKLLKLLLVALKCPCFHSRPHRLKGCIRLNNHSIKASQISFLEKRWGCIPGYTQNVHTCSGSKLDLSEILTVWLITYGIVIKRSSLQQRKLINTCMHRIKLKNIQYYLVNKNMSCKKTWCGSTYTQLKTFKIKILSYIYKD